MNVIPQKTLTEFGLSEKEAKIYLALLELEIATVSQIAKITGINRSSAYVIIESLKNQGLVSCTDDKSVQQYLATSPEVLMRTAEDLARKQEVTREKISKIIPELKALYKGTKQRPKVQVFEGKQGLINAFEDTLNMKEKLIRISSSAENLIRILPDYFPEYLKSRKKMGIKMHGIHPDSTANRMFASHAFTNLDTIVLIPEKKYSFPADLAIFDDKIGYMSVHEKGISITIESKEMANVMKSVFDLAFEEAKRLAVNKRSKK